MPEPDPARDSLDLVDRLVAEYADRLARDEDPRREELLAQAPGFRAELERCFAMLEVGEQDGPGALAQGFELGGYRLGRVLGRGGMAVVYEAEDMSLGRRVALKVLRAHLTLERRHFERFQREARAAAKLAHENVVPIHAVGEAGGHVFLTLELIEGPTLARVIAALIEGQAARGARPTATDLARACGDGALAQAPTYAQACVRLLSGVLRAVQYAHEKGVIHRDLKPANVLLTRAGKPLVADFGLAKDLGEVSLSLTGETLGTPHYMSPEQAGALSNSVDARTDVYSLGVVLYELLSLRRPFEGNTLRELVTSIVTIQPRSPCELASDLPERLGDVVLKAMAKQPERRYPSVAALAADLERALSGAEVQARPARGMGALFGGWFEAQTRGMPFEYRSKGSLFGLPWIHVVSGVRDPHTLHPKWAKGVLAAGDHALGLYAAGKFAVGFVALGGIAIGPVALGLLAFGHAVIGAVAFGWNVKGGMVAGYSGRGLLSEWLVRPLADTSRALGQELPHGGSPSPALLTSLVGIFLSVTMIHGIWSRVWSGEEERHFVRRVTRIWMPLAFLLPLALAGAGLELPLMANLLLVMGITLAFGALTRRVLGKPPVAG